MRAEPGDKSVLVDAGDVARAARGVGIVRGDTVMFHSALSSMGTVVGGPNTVIDGFLEAVGAEGTVATPSLWWQGDHMSIEDWDPETSPSYPGAITEAMRLRPGRSRSDNPTHAVAAVGARAEELTRDHGKWGLRPCVFGDTAFAEASPWERFYQWDAAYCFIGIDFTYNTMGHYIEVVFAQRTLAQAPEERREALLDGLRRWQKPGAWARYPFQKMGERLAEEGLVRFAKIGCAVLRCIRTKAMVNRTLEILEAEAEDWFIPEFLPWLREARGG